MPKKKLIYAYCQIIAFKFYLLNWIIKNLFFFIDQNKEKGCGKLFVGIICKII